jgi:FkbM family methyltransferase
MGSSFKGSNKNKSTARCVQLLICGLVMLYGFKHGAKILFHNGSPAPSTHEVVFKYVTSPEWLTKEKQETYFLNDESTRVTVYRDDFWNLVQKNEWETQTFKVIKHFLDGHPDASYIDFGAWIGPTVLLAAQYSKHVYTLEPDHRAFSALVANVNANSNLAPNIQLYHECINTKSGPMTFRGAGASTSRFINNLKPENVENLPEWTIPCRTLPEFITQEGITQLRLVKIDTEGAELFLLPSLASWLHLLPSPKPSIWLSVHQPFWKEDVSAASKQALWAVFKAYKYAYLEGTASMAIHKEDHKLICKDFCTYLLTDEEFIMP